LSGRIFLVAAIFAGRELPGGRKCRGAADRVDDAPTIALAGSGERHVFPFVNRGASGSGTGVA
jgi:hypothetical protein